MSPGASPWRSRGYDFGDAPPAITVLASNRPRDRCAVQYQAPVSGIQRNINAPATTLRRLSVPGDSRPFRDFEMLWSEVPGRACPQQGLTIDQPSVMAVPPLVAVLDAKLALQKTLNCHRLCAAPDASRRASIPQRRHCGKTARTFKRVASLPGICQNSQAPEKTYGGKKCRTGYAIYSDRDGACIVMGRLVTSNYLADIGAKSQQT